MIIAIKTDKESIDYKIDGIKDVSNDEICRTITHLEIIKKELLDSLSYDYEVFEK